VILHLAALCTVLRGSNSWLLVAPDAGLTLRATPARWLPCRYTKLLPALLHSAITAPLKLYYVRVASGVPVYSSTSNRPAARRSRSPRRRVSGVLGRSVAAGGRGLTVPVPCAAGFICQVVIIGF
jgi:hypothetical protein